MVCTGERTPYADLQSAETAMAAMLKQGIRPKLSSGEDWRDATTGGLVKIIEALTRTRTLSLSLTLT